MIMIKRLTTRILAVILTMMCFISMSSAGIAHAASPKAVDVIDSIVITELYDTKKVLAEWQSFQPDITVNRNFTSAERVKLFINWSDHNGAIDLQSGDYFTFVIPSVFDHSKVTNVSNEKITDSSGNVVATYSIYTNGQGLKEVKVTFTDYVDTHTKISGDLWMALYVGSVESTETKDMEFVINGELAATGKVTIEPGQPISLIPPVSVKYGYASPAKIADGYYIFEWNVDLNMGKTSDNSGFNVLENFSFEDMIPSDSPHIFLASTGVDEFNVPASYRTITVKEYTGSDTEAPADRYQTFLERYYHKADRPWSNFLTSYTLANGVTSEGIDRGNGLNISNVKITGKSVSANLGRLTRPTVIHFYTIATIKISESALGDPETMKFFKNTFMGSNGEVLSAHLTEYIFASGGSAKGIYGDYNFMFTKINESDSPLSGVWFSLYTNESCTGGADRFAFSDNNGIVAFNNIAEGVYYFRETIVPEGYVLDASIYKVEITMQGYTIYYGVDFENRLSDQGNRITNKLEKEPEIENPPTGDVSNNGLWIIMLALATGIILHMLLTALKSRKG